MKTKHLLAKLNALVNTQASIQQEEIRSIKKLLKKLKQKERDLRKKLEHHKDEDERAEIATKIEVIYAQRMKGVERLRALINEAKE